MAKSKLRPKDAPKGAAKGKKHSIANAIGITFTVIVFILLLWGVLFRGVRRPSRPTRSSPAPTSPATGQRLAPSPAKQSIDGSLQVG
jgi:hypothetical protein